MVVPVAVAVDFPPPPQPAATSARTATNAGSVFLTASILLRVARRETTRALREQLIEAGGVLERPDHREVQTPLSDQVARHSLDILRRHLVELGQDLLRLRRPALEH